MLARIRCCLILIVSISILVIFYFTFTFMRSSEKINGSYHMAYLTQIQEEFNLWMIFTKVYRGSLLKYKFINLIENLMNVSSVPLMLNIIVDNSSRNIAEKVIVEQMEKSNRTMTFAFYNIDSCAKIVDDIVGVMSRFFSKPGSYYSDVLFYISLGLHRIAPKKQKHAILVDCDVFFKRDIALLFDEFKRFKPTALFGLAPELSPVYRHVLKLYRSKHNTTFGNYYHWNETNNPNIRHSRGFQGYNSGILLLKLDAIRNSDEFKLLLEKSTVQTLTQKYNFKQGHLGDQDFYTLVGNEYPHLIQTLNCGFNKQLCTWWKENGYSDIFDNYARCDHSIVVLHGNCNTKIPK